MPRTMMSDFSGMVCEIPCQCQFGCLDKNGTLEGDGSHPRHRNSTLVSGQNSVVPGPRTQTVDLLEKVNPPLACHQVCLLKSNLPSIVLSLVLPTVLLPDLPSSKGLELAWMLLIADPQI
ncbi:hypothetical protein lerEdw1_000547 [Lerista edwardsae]|nr:hypothetical protein lerEdw1_000547 [Lerista edwardsae]